MTRKVTGTIALTIALVIGLASAASAYFTASASGTQLATSTTLSSPVTVTAAAAGTTGLTVSVTTGPSTPAATGYIVYPHGSTSSPACTITGSTGSCPVTGLTAGSTTSYDVYSTLGNWISSASSPLSGTTTPAKPSSVVVAGTGYVGSGNKTNAEVDVTLPATSSTSDTLHVTISDGTTTVTVPTKAGSSGAGTVAFTGIDLSSLSDGPLTITVWSTNAGGASANLTAAAVKDTAAPAVTIAAPAAGSTTSTTTPTFTGTAGSQASDSGHSADASTVSVKLYAGTTATGSPIQTLSAPVSAGSWSVAASSALTVGNQYTVQATQTDGAGNSGTSTSVTFTAGNPTPPGLTFVNVTTTASSASYNPTVSCPFVLISYACTISPEVPNGNSRTLTAQVALMDANGQVVANTTGSPITIALVAAGAGLKTFSPATVTIAAGATNSGAFTLTLTNGSTLQATVTATAIVGLSTYVSSITS
jgi:hypothetical protein